MNSLWGNIFKVRQKKEDAIRDILKRVPIFEDLGGRDLDRIERILHRREYGQDDIIFLQGQPGLGMYIIEEGTIEILSEPEKVHLAELHSGEFFGELALLDDSPRTATVIARTYCKLLCLFQPDLFDLIDRNRRLGIKILFRLASTIGQRLKKMNEYLSETMKSGENDTLFKGD
jgi:CRP/FNR family cyclic AMP-dependent transcriptional regulator